MDARTILITGARQVLTLQGSRGPRRGAEMQQLSVIPHGAVLVREGKILSVGPARRVENLAEARRADEIDATDCILLPGLTDPYCFPAAPSWDPWEELDPKRAPLAAAAAAEGAELRALAAACRATAGRALESATAAAAHQMAAYGVTSAAARSGLGLDESGERKLLRALHRTASSPVAFHTVFFGARCVPPEFEARGEDEFLGWLTGNLLPRLMRHNLADAAEVRIGTPGISPEGGRRFFAEVRKAGLPYHASCTGKEAAAAAYAVQDAVPRSLTLLGSIPESVAAAVAPAAEVITLLPLVDFLRDTLTPVTPRSLVQAGAAIAIGTGFDPSSHPGCNLLEAVALICLRGGLSLEEAICAVTVNAACAAGFAGEAGTIEYGRSADLTALRIPDYREIPYRTGMNLVKFTMKQGIVVYGRKEVPCSNASSSASPISPREGIPPRSGGWLRP